MNAANLFTFTTPMPTGADAAAGNGGLFGGHEAGQAEDGGATDTASAFAGALFAAMAPAAAPKTIQSGEAPPAHAKGQAVQGEDGARPGFLRNLTAPLVATATPAVAAGPEATPAPVSGEASNNQIQDTDGAPAGGVPVPAAPQPAPGSAADRAAAKAFIAPTGPVSPEKSGEAPVTPQATPAISTATGEPVAPAPGADQSLRIASARREAVLPDEAGVAPLHGRAGVEKTRSAQPPAPPVTSNNGPLADERVLRASPADEIAPPPPAVSVTGLPPASAPAAPAGVWTHPAVIAAIQGQTRTSSEPGKPLGGPAARVAALDDAVSAADGIAVDASQSMPGARAVVPPPALDAKIPVELSSAPAAAVLDEAGFAAAGPEGELASLLNAGGGPGAEDAPLPAATTQTVSHLASQIFDRLGGAKATRFQVDLNPAGLGRVEVRVEISMSGELTAALSFENPAAAQELRARAGELQSALQQAGFDVSRTALHFDSGNHFGQGLWDQNQQGDRRPEFTPRAFADLSDTPETQSASPSRHSRAGGVDVTI